MENASKALIMAAGVLIGLLILSLAVYLFANFGAASAEAHRVNAQDQINQFNVQFTAYQGRSDVTIYDVVTAANLANNSNSTYELTGPNSTNSNYYIQVNATTTIGYRSGLEKYSDNELNELVAYELSHLSTYVDENGTQYQGLPTYTCRVEINQNTDRVSTVTFTRNRN